MKNLVNLLCLREIGVKTDRNISLFCEHRCVSDRYRETKCLVPNTVRSTFVVAFSPCGKCVASAHGDHRIYLFDLITGRKLNTLIGHSRTPWTLVWHPINNQLLASGCLAGEVKIWFIHSNNSIHSTVNYNVLNCVASLAFHPLERVLIIASLNEMHYWDWSQTKPFIILKTNCQQERIRLIKWTQNSLITGISNLPNIQYNSESFNRKHSLLSRIVGIYRNSIEDNNNNNSNNRLQSIMESIDQQLVSNQSNDFICSSLLNLQSLLQSSQQLTNLQNINQIKIRITRIVEKLLSLTYCSEENQIRRKINESIDENSLTHCLWLIQKAIQLSRLMSNQSTSSSSSSIPTIVIDSVVDNNSSETSNSNRLERERSPPFNETIRSTMVSNSRSLNTISWFPYMSPNPSIMDFRLQCWHQNTIPNIKDSNSNIVAAKVRIHNDASVDISNDGQLLVCLVPNTTNCVNLSLYSLNANSFGHLLCQWSFGSNAISVSLSPTSQYIVVGISSICRSQVIGLNGKQENDTIAQIFKRKDQLLEHIRNVEILRSDSITSVNSIRFMPNCGHGLVYGTNRGQLVIARPDGDSTQ